MKKILKTNDPDWIIECFIDDVNCYFLIHLPCNEVVETKENITVGKENCCFKCDKEAPKHILNYYLLLQII